MGLGYGIYCENCFYNFEAFLGIGMTYTDLYEKTISDIRKGKYGEDYKRFIEEHRMAYVDCENDVAVCTRCGKLDTVINMSLYLPNTETTNYRISHVTKAELLWEYHKCMEYNHKCSCGGDYQIVDNFFSAIEDGTIRCPRCKGMLKRDRDTMIFWD